jgi:hypothetical protein
MNKRKHDDIESIDDFMKRATLEDTMPFQFPQPIIETSVENKEDKSDKERILDLENTVIKMSEQIKKMEYEIFMGKMVYRELFKKTGDNALINRVLADLFEVDINSILQPNKRQNKKR